MHVFSLWAFVERPASISKLAHTGPSVGTNFSGGSNYYLGGQFEGGPMGGGAFGMA